MSEQFNMRGAARELGDSTAETVQIISFSVAAVALLILCCCILIHCCKKPSCCCDKKQEETCPAEAEADEGDPVYLTSPEISKQATKLI